MVSQHDQQKPDNLLVLKKNKTVEANGQRFNNKQCVAKDVAAAQEVQG